MIENLGRIVAGSRLLLGLSQQELAEAVGVHRTTIVKVEKCNLIVKLISIKKLFDYFESKGVVINFDNDSFDIKFNKERVTYGS